MVSKYNTDNFNSAVALVIGVGLVIYWVVEIFLSIFSYLFATFGIVPGVIVSLSLASYLLVKFGVRRKNIFFTSLGRLSNTLLAGACACLIVQLSFLWMHFEGHFTDSTSALEHLDYVNSILIKIFFALSLLYLLLLVFNIAYRRCLSTKVTVLACLNQRLGKITLAVKTMCFIIVMPTLIVSVHQEYKLRNIISEQAHDHIVQTQAISTRALVYAMMLYEIENLNMVEKQALAKLFYQEKALVELFVNGYNKGQPHPDIVKAFQLHNVKPIKLSMLLPSGSSRPGLLDRRSNTKDYLAFPNENKLKAIAEAQFEFVTVKHVPSDKQGVVRFMHHLRVTYDHSLTVDSGSELIAPEQYVEAIRNYSTDVIATWKLATPSLLLSSATAEAEHQATSKLLSQIRNELIDKIAATVTEQIGFEVDDANHQLKQFINILLEQTSKSYMEFIAGHPNVKRSYEGMLGFAKSLVVQLNADPFNLPLRGLLLRLTPKHVSLEISKIIRTVKGIWAAGIQEAQNRSAANSHRRYESYRVRHESRPRPRPRGR